MTCLIFIQFITVRQIEWQECDVFSSVCHSVQEGPHVTIAHGAPTDIRHGSLTQGLFTKSECSFRSTCHIQYSFMLTARTERHCIYQHSG